MNWMNVNDAQPPIVDRYLVIKEYTEVYAKEIMIERFVSRYFVEIRNNERVLVRHWVWAETGLEPQRVTHWMPLPKMPKLNTKEEKNEPDR